MKKRHKNIFVTLLLSTMLMLGACSDGNASADVGDYPEIVQSGEVSTKYYDEVANFSGTSEEIYFKLGDLFQDLDNETKDAHKKELIEYNNVLNSYKLKPKTKIDKEMNEIVNLILDEQLSAIEDAIEYLENDDTDSLELVHKRMKIIMDSSLELDLLREGF